MNSNERAVALDAAEQRIAKGEQRTSRSAEETIFRLAFDPEYLNILKQQAEGTEGLSDDELI